MDSIQHKHKALITGLAQVLQLLVKLHYIASTDIVYPPHVAPQPEVDIPRLHKLGFDLEVISLAQVLPYLRNEVVWGWQDEGIEIIPRGKLANYFLQPASSAGDQRLERLRVIDCDKRSGPPLFHPWILRLTFPALSCGEHLLYNVRTQTIVHCRKTGEDDWGCIPNRPCHEFFSEVIHKLQTLQWIPLHDPSDKAGTARRRIEEDPMIFQNIFPEAARLPYDHRAALNALAKYPDTMETLRHRINRWRALRKLYLDAGWSGVFDKELFHQKREELIRGSKEAEGERRGLESSDYSQQQMSDPRASFERYNRFWEEKAGNLAIR